jgi:hypothetical protein
MEFFLAISKSFETSHTLTTLTMGFHFDQNTGISAAVSGLAYMTTSEPPAVDFGTEWKLFVDQVS